MKYRVKDGSKDDFPVKDVKVVQDGETRTFIAKAVVIVACALLLAAAAFMMVKGDADGLHNVLTLTLPFLGMVMGYYFAKAK